MMKGNSTMFNFRNFSPKNMNMNRMFSRMFREAENVVWDVMSGGIGIVDGESGIATLTTKDGVSTVTVNPFDDFGLPIPAFAQNTPVADVKVGDVIYRGPNNIAWVTSKDDTTGIFKLMKPNGDITEFQPPKVSFGLDGVMVLRTMMSVFGNGTDGTAGFQGVQGMLVPMLQMAAFSGSEVDMSSIMQMVMFSSLSGMNGSSNNMMQMMFIQQFMQQMMQGNQNNPARYSQGGRTGFNGRPDGAFTN